MNKYAIIGFGCAGYHAARALRERRPDAQIDVFEQTGRGGANPMLTTYYAGGKIDFAQLFPFGDAGELCRELGLELCAEPVTRVETDTREVCTGDGKVRRYDRILICTGASALLPAFIRVEGREVLLMRTVQDAQRLKRRLEECGGKTAAVIGASMVGIKVAEVLHHHGVKTTLMDAAGRIFPLAAYPCVADRIQAALEERGLDLMMDVRVGRVGPEGVEYGGGRLLPADIVCLCVGTRANTELVANTRVVEGQGIRVERGIVVNSRMETSCPGIYAAGDCCEGINLQTGQTMIIGLWANAAAQGECAGSNMAGHRAEYHGNIPHNITRFFDMTFAGIGDPDTPGELLSFPGRDTQVHVVADRGRIVSLNILGGCEISGVLKNLLIKRIYTGTGGLSPAQRGLLAAAGLPWAFIKYLGGDVS